MTKVDLKQFAQSGAVDQNVIRYNATTGLWEPGVAAFSGGGGAPTAEDKNLIPFATGPGNGQDTGIEISEEPIGDRYVTVIVNGISSSIGDGYTSLDCYFSIDGGLTALNLSAITTGARLYWNSTIAGFQLAPTDVVDLDYDVLDGYSPGPGPSGDCGWTDDGAVVRLTTITDFVGVGTVAPNLKFDVVGDIGVSSSLVVGPLATAATVGEIRLNTDNWVMSRQGVSDVGVVGYDSAGTMSVLGHNNPALMPSWTAAISTNGFVAGSAVPYMAVTPNWAGVNGVYINLDSIHFEETITNPIITQDATNSAGAASYLELSAQDNSNAAGIGGNLLLEPGDGTLMNGGVHIGFNHSTTDADIGVCIGRYASAENYGEVAQSNGVWSSAGESQSSSLVLRNASSGAVTVDLFLDGMAEYFVLDTISTYIFEIKVVGSSPSLWPNIVSAAYKFELCGRRDNFGTQIMGLVSKTIIYEDEVGWDCDIDIDDTGADELNIQCTGIAGRDIFWTAYVRATKVQIPPI